jgi:hypothetical protein
MNGMEWNECNECNECNVMNGMNVMYSICVNIEYIILSGRS